MIGEIIAIGDELTSGRILNSTSYFAASQLFAAGHEIVSMSTIGDSSELIGSALKRALGRADFVVLTGGLGATSDDLTNEAVSTALGRPIIFYPEIFEKICSRALEKPSEEGREPRATQSEEPGKFMQSPAANLEKLAWLPEGAVVLKPESRMAGYLLVHEEKPIFLLPGVPYEMKELLVERVIPYLAARKDKSAQHVKQKIYKVFGLAETAINRKLKQLEIKGEGARIGYYPVYPEVHVGLTVLNLDEQEAKKTFAHLDSEITEILGEYVYGADDDTLETVVGRLLASQKKTVALAESCSGGLISHKITKVSGSSEYFVGGVVAYSNFLKESILGVDGRILRQYGAVSSETAKAMAEGVRRLAKADVGLSVTGIAGPSGGSPEKPVGTVYIGLSTPSETRGFLFHFSGDRWQIQVLTAFSSLDLLRRALLGVVDLSR